MSEAEVTKGIVEGVAKGAGSAIGATGLIFLGKWGSPYLKKLGEQMHGSALQTATRRLGAFVEKLIETRAQSNSRKTDPEQIVARLLEDLKEPASVLALNAALDAARSTDSADRISILAGMVSERLKSSKESTKAMVVNRAIEVAPQLSETHLRIVELFASSYIQRNTIASEVKAYAREVMTNLRRIESDEAEVDAIRDDFLKIAKDSGRLLSLFHDAKIEEDAKLGVILEANQESPGHQAEYYLQSVGCVTVHGWTDSYNNLHSKLHSIDSKSAVQFAMKAVDTFDRALSTEILTPVGLLLGMMMIDATRQSKYVVEWNWGDKSKFDDDRSARDESYSLTNYMLDVLQNRRKSSKAD